MDHRPIVNTLVVAAVIVVVLPMLAVVALVARSGIAVENSLRIPMFGPMGALQILSLGWSMAAVAIVAAVDQRELLVTPSPRRRTRCNENH